MDFNVDQTKSDVNLGVATNGAELLDGLSHRKNAAKLQTNNAGDQGYLLAYDNDNAYLSHFGSGRNKTVSAWEIQLIGILDSPEAIAVGALDASQFVFI